jgi:hypothetical protein
VVLVPEDRHIFLLAGASISTFIRRDYNAPGGMVPKKRMDSLPEKKYPYLFGILQMHFTKPLLHTSSPIIPKLRLSFNNILSA